MIDLEKATDVEVEVDSTGKMWVNVDGKCTLRIGYVGNLTHKFPESNAVSFTGPDSEQLPLHKPEDYKLIHAWGVRMGSFMSYISNEQRLAALTNAPLDTLCITDGDKCHRFVELMNNDARRDLIDFLQIRYPADDWSHLYPTWEAEQAARGEAE